MIGIVAVDIAAKATYPEAANQVGILSLRNISSLFLCSASPLEVSSSVGNKTILQLTLSGKQNALEQEKRYLHKHFCLEVLNILRRFNKVKFKYYK